MAGRNGRTPHDASDDDEYFDAASSVGGVGGSDAREDLDDDDNDDGEDYSEMLLLDQLESLEEEMMELGVTSLDEVRERIRELHTQLGD